MRTLLILTLSVFVTTTAQAAGNKDKLVILKAYQDKELKTLVKKQGNIGKQAKALMDQISNGDTFCRGSRAEGKDCAAMLDKALQAKKQLEAQNALLEQAELQSATGGAAVTGNAEKSGVKQDSKWQKGHVVGGPKNTSNTVGAPKYEAKKAPVMGTKKKPTSENDEPKQ